MSLDRLHKNKKSSKHLAFMQVLFVFLAFAVMVTASFIFTINIERNHLEREANTMFLNIESQLDSMLQEIESGSYNRRDNTWVLLDNNFNIIAYSDYSYWGTHLSDFQSGLADAASKLERDNKVENFRYINHAGESKIINIRELDNGCYLGVAALVDVYYTNRFNTQWFLILIGMGLAAILSVILMRLVVEKNKAEAYSQILLNAMPLCANFWDENFNNITTNDESVKLFELKNQQEYIDRFHELSPEFQPNGEKSDDKAFAYIKKAFNEGYCRFEWMHQKLNGELIPAEITLVRVEYKNGFIVAGYTRDLREEKEMARKLEERDLLLSTVNQVAGTLLTIKSEDSFEDVLVKSMEILSEYRGGEESVHIWRNSNDDDARIIYHSYLWQKQGDNNEMHIPLGAAVSFDELSWGEEVLIKGNSMYSTISEMSPKDRLHFETYGIKSVVAIPLYVHGRLWGMFSIDNNKTERSFSEDEVKILRSAGLMMAHAIMRSEMLGTISMEHVKNENLAHWYHSILDAIPLPISVTDENKKWTFVNSAIEMLLGIKRKDLIGWDCSTFDTPICNTDKCGIACIKRGETQTFFDYKGLSFKAEIAKLRDLNGEPAGYIEISTDITEIKAMAKKQMETEAASNAKSAFLATVSHEIRTPMNTILGISEIQLQKDHHPPETAEAFYQICDASDLLLNIINDILDLSKIEAGKLDITAVRYDIASMINDSIQLNYMRYESKPINFIIDLNPGTPVEFYGDEFRIKQVFNNLLSNAFKYTEEGDVKLSVSAEDPGLDTGDVTLIIQISDTGQGLSKEELNSLFDEFTRFTTNRTIVGTGLGMSITKRLIDMMNGEINVESTPGEGSVFTVRLPQKRVGNSVCGEELAEKFRSFNFKSRDRLKKAQIVREFMPYGSVLVVDDVSSNLQVAEGMLLPYGLKIELVSSGYEAIDKINAGNVYDIIFMDHMMPKMDGMETVKILRDNGYDRTIIALTANAIVGQEDVFLRSGFDAFVSKPIDSRELNIILNDYIRNRKPKEIVDAAREEQSRANNAGTAQKQLNKCFIQDAENALSLLENELSAISEANVDLYETTIHGMKSALINIGESEHSAFAYELEKYAMKRKFTAILEKTPAFVNTVRMLIEKYKPHDEEQIIEISEEAKAELEMQLSAIETACERFDKRSAKKALEDLRRRNWTKEINEVLDEISGHLLHSAFKKAAETAKNAVK
jgi:PAS domain S-box-containing protein